MFNLQMIENVLKMSLVITYTKHNMAYNNISSSPEFTLIDSMFKTHGWKLIIHNDDCVIYSKPGEDTEFFEIKKGIASCSVSFPLKRIPFQYVSKFTDYSCACKYVEARFKDFVGSYPIII